MYIIFLKKHWLNDGTNEKVWAGYIVLIVSSKHGNQNHENR